MTFLVLGLCLLALVYIAKKLHCIKMTRYSFESYRNSFIYFFLSSYLFTYFLVFRSLLGQILTEYLVR